MAKENIITDTYAGKTLTQEAQDRRRKGLAGFDGATFIDERNNGMNVHIALTNSGTEDKRIALFAGDLENVAEILKVAGLSVDAVAVEGAVIAALFSGICYSRTILPAFPASLSFQLPRPFVLMV